MPESPFLSVVMPVHDGAEWIEETLESVAAEPTDGVEIIVIDSSQDDATATIVARYADRLPLQLLRRPDVKPWQTKTNMGVELARAEHACILHQDDLWLPGRVAAVRRWIERAPGAVLHLAPTAMIDRRGRKLGRWRCPLPAEQELNARFLLQRLLVQNFVAVPAVIFSRSAWLQCGGMDEQLWYTPDWDIWLKLASAGPVFYHDEMTTAFRIHGSSLTVTGSRDAGEFRNQMQIVLDRYLGGTPPTERDEVEKAARASIEVNVRLAAVSGGSFMGVFGVAANIVRLGPAGMSRYFRDARFCERVMPRVRARMRGAF